MRAPNCSARKGPLSRAAPNLDLCVDLRSLDPRTGGIKDSASPWFH